MEIRDYTTTDRDRLIEMFARNLETNRSYISHGEIQMGLSSDGQNLAPNFKEKWRRYLDRHSSEPTSFINVCEDNGLIIGFVIFGIEDDHDKEYGVLYDILVTDDYKGTGTGSKLYQCAMEKFKSEGITDCYLESGIDNHNAHSFFEKKGFRHVSNIYRLDKIE